MTASHPLIFTTPAYSAFTADVLNAGTFDKGELELKEFPDGERYHRLISNVANRDVVLIGGTISDSDTLRIFDLASAITKYGARTLTLVIPYFAYSTMDRAVKSGEVVSAKTRAQLLSAIPPAAAGNRVVLIDIHNEGIPYYFEGTVFPVHLYASPIIIQVAKELGGKDFVFGCTDAGRAKWVESLANKCGVGAGVVLKRRLEQGGTELVAISANVSGKLVVIYDDMIRTGGSLLQAARAYKDAGAKAIVAVTTHGLFCDGALGKLKTSRLFSAVVSTDSHPQTRDLSSQKEYKDFLRVESLAPLLAQYLQGSYEAY